jgi:hypothetical protein
MMKTCSNKSCTIPEELQVFGADRQKIDGLTARCKVCRKADRHAYYAANIEKTKASIARWRAANVEKIRTDNLAYAKMRRNTDPLYKLSWNLRCIIGQSIKSRGYSKKSKTHQLLGADFETVRLHLETTWLKNYGTLYVGQLVDVDHVVPCEFAKNESELLDLQHYTNLQYLTSEDNLEKRDYISDKWRNAQKAADFAARWQGRVVA